MTYMMQYKQGKLERRDTMDNSGLYKKHIVRGFSTVKNKKQKINKEANKKRKAIHKAFDNFSIDFGVADFEAALASDDPKGYLEDLLLSHKLDKEIKGCAAPLGVLKEVCNIFHALNIRSTEALRRASELFPDDMLAEIILAHHVRGSVSFDKGKQYNDIDVIAEDGTTYSVKCTNEMFRKFDNTDGWGTVTLELLQSRKLLDEINIEEFRDARDSNEAIYGNFAGCEADKLAFTDGINWRIYNVKELRRYVLNHLRGTEYEQHNKYFEDMGTVIPSSASTSLGRISLVTGYSAKTNTNTGYIYIYTMFVDLQKVSDYETGETRPTMYFGPHLK